MLGHGSTISVEVLWTSACRRLYWCEDFIFVVGTDKKKALTLAALARFFTSMWSNMPCHTGCIYKVFPVWLLIAFTIAIIWEILQWVSIDSLLIHESEKVFSHMLHLCSSESKMLWPLTCSSLLLWSMNTVISSMANRPFTPWVQ